LSRLAGGRVETVDQAARLSGYTYHPAAVDEIADGVAAALPEGYTVAASAIAARQDDQPVAADRCRNLLQAALQVGRIEFDEAKSALAADSFGLLDRISAVVARCPDANIEVGAHSDADGSAAKNRDRTQARAEAIVDYLVSAGVKRERLTAVGYGEAKPIADNNTAQGKAMNRRIEFSVAAPSGG
jgi:OOP family OmpA-OmpF porin